ncbi:DUF4129 domain-containing protein [Brevibacterium luteolum]|uniref:DUF4129 domain-containing protein n=1 Tax=Brevibacterium luteolum TaxID=199591 RepID=UPI00223C3DD4|nr:DUF4129 domain-containing protein [Brevibacterium luteolum]MCT1658038.1 DUF4129 domain-containing protein [Brevibacterium luteolum]
MSTPLTPDRDEARRWVEKKLSEPEYRDADLSPLEKLGRAIDRFFGRLIDSAVALDSPWTLLIIAAVIVVIVVLVIRRVRRGTSGGVDLAAFDLAQSAETINPQAFWDAAQTAAGRGDYTLAVQNGVRAIFARFVAAGLIDMTAASTASELAGAAAAACPPAAADVHAAGALFDAVTFGEAHASAADWQDLLSRAERISASGAGPALASTASGAGSRETGA